MSPRAWWRLFRWELRGAGLRAVPFLASLSVGVAAVVLVAGLGDSLARAIRQEARPLLGADVAVRSFDGFPAELDGVAAAFPGTERVDTLDFLTMVAVPAAPGGPPGRSVMVELKAVPAGWPFYGAPVVEPARPLEELLGDDGLVVQPALLERLGLEQGARVRLGSVEFVVRGVILAEPGRLPSGLVAGPRVLISPAGLARAGLGDVGARRTHRALFHEPDEARAIALAEHVRGLVGTRATVETWADAQPAAQRSIAQTTAWMGLVALLSLLVGGVGIAQATRAWMARRLDTIAIQRTLGLTASEVASLTLVQAAVLAIAGSALGALLGTGALALAPLALEGLLPVDAVQPWQPAAVARGVGLGLGMALLFAWRPLAQAARVPPLRVLRRDIEPLPESALRSALALGTVAIGVFLLAFAQARDPFVAGAFVLGLAVVSGLAAAGAALLVRLMRPLAHRVRSWWLRHGLASVGRPGSGLVPAVVALGLGATVVLTTVLVEGRLYAQIAQEFPESAPSAFLLDVQPDQVAGVQSLLAEVGAVHTRAAPMVVGRLVSVDGVGAEELAAQREEGDRWQLTREQRLSYMPALPADNTILEGAPFSEAVTSELSIEERYAERLGVKLGSVVQFDVQGVPVELRVTSIRSVSWQSFNMNFFLVAEPGVLEAAPQTHLVTTQLPAELESSTQDRLATAFPNVTMVSVRTVLAQARGLLERLAWAVRAVGAFTAAAGVAILATGIIAEAGRRGRQVALLKTLGTTRAGVMGLLAVEYALVGLLAGLVGSVGAVGLSWVLVTRVMTLSWATDWWAVGFAVGGAAFLVSTVGVLANQRALRVPPAQVLRGE